MVKAVLIKETGSPSVLKVTDVNFRAPKQNEVIIRHTAVGVNYLDIEQRSGLYKLKDNTERLKLPAIIGAEAVGVVEQIGEGSAINVKQGDRVCYCTLPYGAYAEKRLVNAEYLIKVPSNIPDEVVASGLYKGLMAFYLTSRAYIIRDNITVMVHDVTSDIGNILCQWIKAKSAKCKIIGTVRSADKLGLAANLGCDLVLDYNDDYNTLYKQVMEFTNGHGVSAVYDNVGKDTYLLSLNSLSMFGLYLLYEQRSGSIPPMNWQAFRAKSLFFTYPSLFHYSKATVQLAFSVAEVFHFIQKKMVTPRIAKKYKLENVADAHRDLESGSLNGSAVIVL